MRKQQLRTWAIVCAACLVAACDSGGGSGGAGASANGSAGVSGGPTPIGGTTGTAGTSSAGTGVPTAGASAGTTGAAGVHATAGSGTAGAAGHDGTAGTDGTAGAAGHDGAGAGGTSGHDGTTCDLACDVGTHCELTEVQCIQAPCPPVEECVEDPHCGGFAAFPCPGMGECHDDPRDSCDPMHGGADCGGICACAEHGLCAEGQTWDNSPAVCGCVATDDAGKKAGEACGKVICAEGMVCCNASCGICTQPNEACIQIACL